MRSPKDMDIIEIDITNACVHSCSNCTRMCGHHKKSSFMTFEQFKNAIDSLEDWNGLVGIIGGEPTLHPQFEEFLQYLREKRVGYSVNMSRLPIKNMQDHIIYNLDCELGEKTVLLSSLSPSYYKHFEAINDTFKRQLLNDHSNACEHQALLMSRKELGITDDEWKKKRDACWIQNTWSATITPKGAFFCEVAGALDTLFNGPGGWKVEKGWYNRTPDEFTDQLHWCELCSACLDVPKRLSNEEIDDVTPLIFEKLKEIESPKVKTGRCVVRDPDKYAEYSDPTYVTGNEYMEAGKFERISSGNNNLKPKSIFSVDKKHFDYDIVKNNASDWIAVFDKSPVNVEWISNEYILNPGCYYIFDDEIELFNLHASSLRNINNISSFNDVRDSYEKGKVIHFSTRNKYSCVINGLSDEEYEPQKDNYSKLIIYGAGNVAEKIVTKLIENNEDNFYIAVTDKCNAEDKLLGYPVHNIDELTEMKNEAVVVLATSRRYHTEIRNKLLGLGFENIREPLY